MSEQESGCNCEHEHNEDCNCGNNEEFASVTLTLDNDEVIECAVLTFLQAGGKEYIALLPIEQADTEEGDVYLYQYSETEDGEPTLENIEDDNEYEAAADAFDEWLDAQEFEDSDAE